MPLVGLQRLQNNASWASFLPPPPDDASAGTARSSSPDCPAPPGPPGKDCIPPGRSRPLGHLQPGVGGRLCVSPSLQQRLRTAAGAHPPTRLTCTSCHVHLCAPPPSTWPHTHAPGPVPRPVRLTPNCPGPGAEPAPEGPSQCPVKGRRVRFNR